MRKKNHKSSWVHYMFGSWKIFFNEKLFFFFNSTDFRLMSINVGPGGSGSDTTTLLEDKSVFFYISYLLDKTKLEYNCKNATYDSDTSVQAVYGALKNALHLASRSFCKVFQ